MSQAFWIRALAVSALVVTSLAGAQSQGRQAPTWEYREVQLSTSSSSLPAMNRLGAEGWELVSVVSACPGTNVTGNPTPCQWWAYFKRRSS